MKSVSSFETGFKTQILWPQATRCNFPFYCHSSHVKNYPPQNEQMLQCKTENIYPPIYPSIHLSWWDARGNASPTGHTHARTHKEWTAVGLTQDYLCLTCLSPTAACCSWPSRCFSLSFFLSFYSSLFHTHLTLVHVHAHTFQPLSILSLKGSAFEAWSNRCGSVSSAASSNSTLA